MSLSSFGCGVVCGIAGTLGVLTFGTVVFLLADRVARRNAQDLESACAARVTTP